MSAATTTLLILATISLAPTTLAYLRNTKHHTNNTRRDLRLCLTITTGVTTAALLNTLTAGPQ